MAIDKEKLLKEIKLFAEVDDETWKREGISGGITRVLVEEIIARRSKRLAKKYPFNFLERIYQTASMTSNVFNSALSHGTISTTGEDVRVSSDGYFLEYDHKIFRIAALRIDDVPASFVKRSDVLLDRDRYTNNPTVKFAFRDLSDSKGKNRVALFADASSSQIEMVCFAYPDDYASFPEDFYDYFKDVALLEVLKEPRSQGAAALRSLIKQEHLMLEQELIAEYTRDLKIELVHEYNQECNMTYTEQSGGYIK